MKPVDTLNTSPGRKLTLRAFTLAAAFALLAVTFAACGKKKCQPPETEKFKTITATEWRLVETTDPSPGFKKLSNTTFYIFKFEPDYKGTVHLVVNNTKRDEPEFNMVYNIDPEAGALLIKYNKAVPEDDGTGSDGTEAPASGVPADSKATQSGVTTYGYDLGKQLEMTNSRNGAYYRFVPFKGIIEPDNMCEF